MSRLPAGPSSSVSMRSYTASAIFDVVGARLRNHNDTYHGYTVHLHVAFDVRRTKFGTSDVAETDDTVAIFF